MATLTTTAAGTTGSEIPAPGPLGRLARVAYRHRVRTLLVWVVALVVAAGLSAAFSGQFKADYSAPGADSTIAQNLLKERFPAASGDTVNVVVRSAGPVTDPATKARVERLLAQMATVGNVANAGNPFTEPGSISADGRTALTQLHLDVVNPIDQPVANSKQLLSMAQAASTDGLHVSLGGQTIEQAEQGKIGSEGIGLIAAIIILLVMFGSVVAAGLPVIVALAGLAVASMLTGVVAALLPVPDWSTSLATMMGLGVGIDYAMLMVTRFREWRSHGLEPEDATVATLDTAGRSVMLAGSTVVISMLGLFAMGLSFMRGAALVTIVAVLAVMASAMTLFPALLGFFGKRIDRLRIPMPRRARAAADVADPEAKGPSAGWLRWSRFVQRHRVLGVVTGTAVLLLLASPFLGVRFGFPDAGNDVSGTSTRTAYDTVAAAFGPGANGPLLLVAELPSGGSTAAVQEVVTAVEATPNVASVSPIQVNEAKDTAIVSVVPKTGPQAKATETLVHHLRDEVIPQATAGTGTTVHVGGVTAASIDSTANIAKRIPLLIAGVVLLSMVLLLVSFRSVAIAVKAAVMNLLSVAAAYGVVAFVLQGGWFGRIFGIDTRTPLPAFIPVLMFAVLFGLSMDYEVFLIARMREAWLRTHDNATAVVSGLASTARVITAAAAIMVAVFAAFIPSPQVFLKVIGIGMASAIFIDATVVRLLLVPAVMHLLGSRNWWLPAWLERRLPHVHVEGHEEHYHARVATISPQPATSG
ncbi:MAG TPA: MMPL family transporter [Actinomycetes bacterium]|nr:MMPL family transporter [Actinomycetes bacterium]